MWQIAGMALSPPTLADEVTVCETYTIPLLVSAIDLNSVQWGGWPSPSYMIVSQDYEVLIFFPVALRPNAGQGLFIHEVSKSHTAMHHSRYESFRGVTSSSQRPLHDNTQHSQQKNFHAPGGIQTHDLSRRAAADVRLTLRGHLYRLWSPHGSL